MSAAALHVLVTGATGFVGRHVVAALLESGCAVTAISRQGERVRQVSGLEGVGVLEADPFSQDFRFPHSPGAILMHLAWPHLDDYRNPAHFTEALPASRRLLEAAAGAGVARICVAGTCLEYGLVNGEVRPEHPCAPVTAYGLAKLQLLQQIERLFESSASPVWQWIRLFYLHGPGQPPRTLMGQLEAAIARGDDSFAMSLGEQLRDYLDVREAARQFVDLVLAGRPGVHHACSGRPISVRRLVESRIAESGLAMRIELGRFPLPAHEALAFWGSRSIPLAESPEGRGAS